MDGEGYRATRRRFLKTLGLGALALALSNVGTATALPTPKKYKLGEIGFGDNFRFTTEVRGICNYCSVGCGIIFYKRNNEVLYLEGDPDNPQNLGRLCPKGLASIQQFGSRNKRRLTKPLIRVNPKPPVEELKKASSEDEFRAILEKYRPQWRVATWDEAFRYIADKLKNIIENYEKKGEWGPYHSDGIYYVGKLFPMMIEAGAKLTNEEAYLIKKIATLLGSYNIDHDARRCHSTTVAGLAGTVGFGAQTQHFIDTKFISVYLIFGGNPAEAHPVSMQHTLEGKERGTLKLIVVDPKFGRTAAVADIFAFFRPGTDIAFLLYLLHYAFYERNPPVDQLEEFKEMLPRLNATMDDIMEFKEIAKEYDAETVSKITGIPVDKLREIAKLYVENSGVTTKWKKFASIQWAMGQTQHHIGTQITRMSTLLQLTLGNMGFPGGGLNPYRGHSNVQGTTDMCILSHILPGYVKQPPNTLSIRVYQDWKNQGFPDAWHWEIPEWAGNGFGPHGKGEVNGTKILWSWWFNNWRRFELTWGIFVGTDPEDDPEHGKVISDLPFGKGYTENTWIDGALFDGVIKAAFLMAENPAVSDAFGKLTWSALASLDLVVVVDLWETETAWFADVLLPGATQYEKYGSITNSNRWLQWTDRVVPPPGLAMADLWIMKKLYDYLRDAGIAKLPHEVAGKYKEKVAIRNPKTGEMVQLYERKIDVFMDYATHKFPDRDYGEVDPELVYKEIDLAVDLYYGMYDWVRHENLSKRRKNILRTPDRIDGILDAKYEMHKDWGWTWPRNVRILYNLWTLEKTLGMTKTYVAKNDIYAFAKGPTTEKITGETGEMRDAITGEWRPAFLPGHNFLIGKFYKRAWSGMTDIFTGAVTPKDLLLNEKVVGKFVIFKEDGSYEIKTLDEMGVKYPLAESFYYDPEVIAMGRAAYVKPYFKGTKTIGGKTVKFVGWKEWSQVKDAFSKELADCAANGDFRECVLKMIEKYGIWYAYTGKDGAIWAWDMRYPIHYEPVESPDLELATKYPAMAWRRAENMRFLEPVKGWEFLKETVSITPRELQPPEGAQVAVLTTNRLVEHFHTGQLTRNIPLLAELVPEPYAEIPEELAAKIGVKSGDIIEVGNKRNRIYVRAFVTKRLPKLKINGKDVFVINMPWNWGFAGAHRTHAVANSVTALYMDTVTTMQETKVCLVYVKKASPEKYDYWMLNQYKIGEVAE